MRTRIAIVALSVPLLLAGSLVACRGILGIEPLDGGAEPDATKKEAGASSSSSVSQGGDASEAGSTSSSSATSTPSSASSSSSNTTTTSTSTHNTTSESTGTTTSEGDAGHKGDSGHDAGEDGAASANAACAKMSGGAACAACCMTRWGMTEAPALPAVYNMASCSTNCATETTCQEYCNNTNCGPIGDAGAGCPNCLAALVVSSGCQNVISQCESGKTFGMGAGTTCVDLGYCLGGCPQ